MSKIVVALEVVRIADGEVVHRVEVSPGRDPDRVIAGLLRNMDTNAYFVGEVYS